MKLLITIIAYDRPQSLRRLLNSLANCVYPDGHPDLVISIDPSDKPEVLDLSNEFIWQGKKSVNLNQNRLGLKAHVLACGSYVKDYDAILMLEDDLFLSPFFMSYVQASYQYFKDDETVAQISLYSPLLNENVLQPFYPLNEGFDNYYLQRGSSWGQVWTRKMWNDFFSWYNVNETIDFKQQKIPENVASWPNTSSWKKYFNLYLINMNKFVTYPFASYSTNFADPGTHFSQSTNDFQTTLSLKNNEYNFVSFFEAKSVYDAYYENCSMVYKKTLNLPLVATDFEFDLYGTKEYLSCFDYVISSKKSSKPVLTFSSALMPHELNINYSIIGDSFSLSTFGDLESFVEERKSLPEEFPVEALSTETTPIESTLSFLTLFKKVIKHMLPYGVVKIIVLFRKK